MGWWREWADTDDQSAVVLWAWLSLVVVKTTVPFYLEQTKDQVLLEVKEDDRWTTPLEFAKKCSFWKSMLFISKVWSSDSIEQRNFDFLMFSWQKNYFRHHLNAACSVIHSRQKFCQNLSLLFKQGPDIEQLYSNHTRIQFDSFGYLVCPLYMLR